MLRVKSLVRHAHRIVTAIMRNRTLALADNHQKVVPISSSIRLASRTSRIIQSRRRFTRSTHSSHTAAGYNYTHATRNNFAIYTHDETVKVQMIDACILMQLRSPLGLSYVGPIITLDSLMLHSHAVTYVNYLNKASIEANNQRCYQGTRRILSLPGIVYSDRIAEYVETNATSSSSH